MKILAIETSCDESSLSLFTTTETEHGTNFDVYSLVTHSQIDIHKEYGGVFPKLAKREHQLNLVPLLLHVLNGHTIHESQEIHPDITPELLEKLSKILERESELWEQLVNNISKLYNPQIDAICVTSGPGLEPALWVGISFAKALGALWNIPVVPVNHMEGHILSVIVPNTCNPLLFKGGVVSDSPRCSFGEAGARRGGIFSVPKELFPFPALALLISGGHTEIVLVKEINDYEIIGKTRDDAVGEAFDKAARILGLPYPGGPEVSKLAALWPPLREGTIHLPRPMLHTKDYDFSFSGLKTAVLYLVNEIKEKNNGIIPESDKIALAYEFQEAATEVITKKTMSAVIDFGVQTLIVGGGVSANQRIKESLIKTISEIIPSENIHFPARDLTGDNALMIGLAGYYKIKNNPNVIYTDIRAEGNLEL